MQSSAFKAWLNGSEDVEVECGRNDGEPFIVETISSLYHPMNIIVFAHDADDAIQLVHEAFKKCIEINYKTKEPNAGLTSPAERYEQLKKLKWRAKPYNKMFAGRVQWASNDGIVT